MKDSIEDKIFKRMKQNRRGKIFFTNDFAACGNNKACSKALERLTKQEKIVRVNRGIYAIPQKSEMFGTTTPSFDSIVAAIVKRDKARIIPTGLFAENALGLSTQVPMRVVYLTDGVPRTLKIGKATLKFKKTAPKNLATKGKLSGLAIQALKSIRKNRVTDDEIEKIVTILSKENPQYLANDIKLAPEWIKVIMRKALTGNV